LKLGLGVEYDDDEQRQAKENQKAAPTADLVLIKQVVAGIDGLGPSWRRTRKARSQTGPSVIEITSRLLIHRFPFDVEGNVTILAVEPKASERGARVCREW